MILPTFTKTRFLLIIRFCYTVCSKNLLQSLSCFFVFHYDFTEFNTEYQKYIVKKKKIDFLSVEERFTIDKNWKKVEFHGSSVFQFYVRHVRVLYFYIIIFGSLF